MDAAWTTFFARLEATRDAMHTRSGTCLAADYRWYGLAI